MVSDDKAATPDMQATWRKVFATEQPGIGYPTTLAFRYPFTDQIEEALILFPMDGYYLGTKRHAALQSALLVCGSSVYFTSTYEDELNFLCSESVRGDARHYIIHATDSYARHQASVPWPLEYAMYCDAPCWGLIVSHESHAILGGSSRFISEFKSRFPDWREDVAAFKNSWAKNESRGWLQEILPRIAGGLDSEPAQPPDEA